uniref:7TM_GPCR_Srx domain-containing protein n=1 Tax=Steinernema glaseri TaxID=37863 RepID=A0A1I7ZP20_9BILA
MTQFLLFLVIDILWIWTVIDIFNIFERHDSLLAGGAGTTASLGFNASNGLLRLLIFEVIVNKLLGQ